MSQQADNSGGVTGNGDGPLVGREPSAEDRASPDEGAAQVHGRDYGSDPSAETPEYVPMGGTRTTYSRRGRPLSAPRRSDCRRRRPRGVRRCMDPLTLTSLRTNIGPETVAISFNGLCTRSTR